jgi:hypothetical protein
MEGAGNETENQTDARRREDTGAAKQTVAFEVVLNCILLDMLGSGLLAVVYCVHLCYLLRHTRAKAMCIMLPTIE